MEFTLSTESALKIKADILVLGIFKGQKYSGVIKRVNDTLKGALKNLSEEEEDSFFLHNKLLFLRKKKRRKKPFVLRQLQYGEACAIVVGDDDMDENNIMGCRVAGPEKPRSRGSMASRQLHHCSHCGSIDHNVTACEAAQEQRDVMTHSRVLDLAAHRQTARWPAS